MKKFLMNIARLFFGKRNSSSLSRGYVLAFDIFIVLVAILFVPLVGYYPDYPKSSILMFFKGSVSLLLFFIIGFLVSGSYKGLVRYTGFKDIERISRATIWVFIALCLSNISSIICQYFSHVLYRWFFWYSVVLLSAVSTTNICVRSLTKST